MSVFLDGFRAYLTFLFGYAKNGASISRGGGVNQREVLIIDTDEVGEVIDGIVGLAKAVEANDELFRVGANIVWKAYKALIKVGFGNEDAMRILTSQGFLSSRRK